MTKEEKEAVLHCLRAMIDEELCEECPLYGTTGTDHCEKDCVRLAIEELEQEPCDDCISRQAVLDGLANIAKAKARSDAQKALMGRVMFFTEKLPPVNPQKPICPSAGVDCEDCPAYEKKSEWEHDHEILKAYSDGASAVLESLIEQYEHYLELLDADMKDGSATIVTKTKYAVYTEVVKQLKEVLESEDKA